jgi:hypothetical protein
MRLRFSLLTLTLYLACTLIACTKPAIDNPSSTSSPTDSSAGSGKPSSAATEAPRSQPIVVPAGTSITISLGSALGSKTSQPGQTFRGSVSKAVTVAGGVAIPKGANVTGTVTDAKPLGKLAGAALLQVRLDSVNLNGTDLPVHAALCTYSAKGKGKRTGVMAGGGAVVGGLIGGLAGGGKGAAIGMAAGGGAGAGGSALTGNNEVVLPVESTIRFQLSKPLEIAQ